MKAFKTIKEAVFYSTPDNGIMAVYEAADGTETWFVLGKPSIKIIK
jgi:ribonucleotide monophosphatase NagD (HAD superfamily)